MGLGWMWWRALLAGLVATAATLLHFHRECGARREAELVARAARRYRPELGTNCQDTKLCFVSADSEASFGYDYLLMQSAPCALASLARFLSGGVDLNIVQSDDYTEGCHNVPIFDARVESPGSFHETGFTLVTLDEEPVTTDWRTEHKRNKDADIRKFHQQMEPYILSLYPAAKKLVWTYNVVRGGDQAGDQPRAVAGPHLDYHQGDAERASFHAERPVLGGWLGRILVSLYTQATDPETSKADTAFSESNLLLGEGDTEDLQLGVLLGVWKPLSPAAGVCDFPLAVADSRTFQPEQQFRNKVELNLFPGFTVNILGGSIQHQADQTWYYYSHQTPLEVLVFHQYSRGKWFNNPHTSFLNRNCPADSGERVSVEMRLALFF